MASDPWAGEPDRRELFTCGHCGTHGEGVVVGEYLLQSGDPVTDDVSTTRYVLLKCAYCNAPTLDKIRTRTDGEFTWHEGAARLYPELVRADSPAIPDSIRATMTEAYSCVRAQAPTAAALMVRRSLEALAADRGIRSRSLATSIEQLRDTGHIDQRLYDWADALRLAGNDAAHEVSRQPTLTDVRDMIHLADAICDYVYVIQDRYEQFKARRERSTEGSSQDPWEGPATT